jgi:hypothetical protein
VDFCRQGLGRPSPGRYGAAQIGAITAQIGAINVDTYNAELRDSEGLIGDRASKRAFLELLDGWRKRLRQIGEDPLGDRPTTEISKKQLDKILRQGEPEAAGLVHGAVEEFAQELAGVTLRLLKLHEWRDTQRIVVGGGFRASRIGELAIGRASVLLKTKGHDIGFRPIRHHPDEAGLIGTAHLLPPRTYPGYESMLAVDIGGASIRAGIVKFNLKKADDLSATRVFAFASWRHRQAKPTRDQAVEHLAHMLRGLIRRAVKKGLRLAPYVGIGCPGLICGDGSIQRGGQNLPGRREPATETSCPSHTNSMKRVN